MTLIFYFSSYNSFVFGVVFCGLYDYCAFLYVCLCYSTNFYRVISVYDFFFSKFYLDYCTSPVLAIFFFRKKKKKPIKKFRFFLGGGGGGSVQ
jgi:hypothetical protein